MTCIILHDFHMTGLQIRRNNGIIRINKKSSLRVGFFYFIFKRECKIFILYMFKRKSLRKYFLLYKTSLCLFKREIKNILFYICLNENVSHSTSPTGRCTQGTPGGSDFVLFIQHRTFLLISINLKTYNYDRTTHHSVH